MKVALYVGIAGAIGALSRVAIGEFLHGLTVFPLATFIANMIGTFLLCLLGGGLLQRFVQNGVLQTAVTTGFFGSFTTFSAVSMETVDLFQRGNGMIACSYLLASVVAGLFLGFVGMRVGRKLVQS